MIWDSNRYKWMMAAINSAERPWWERQLAYLLGEQVEGFDGNVFCKGRLFRNRLYLTSYKECGYQPTETSERPIPPGNK